MPDDGIMEDVPQQARPIYETADHRSEEEKALILWEHHLKCDIVRTPTKAAVDGLCHRDNMLVGLVETKRRHYDMNHFADLEISKVKMDRAATMAEWMIVPAVLLIQWNDALGWVEIDKQSLTMLSTKASIGRDDRNDPMDKEVGYLIPISRFKVID
jgi:hypothetical protein